MARRNISSGTPWEPVVGYSRAVRVGSLVVVAGTTATDAAGALVGAGDAYAQTVQTLANVRAALERAGARSRTWCARASTSPTSSAGGRWRARTREVFGTIRPATTMVEVSRLVLPEMLVEIEADAWVEGPE